MLGFSFMNVATSSSHSERWAGLVFGGWQPTVIETGAAAAALGAELLPEVFPALFPLSLPPQAVAVSARPVASSIERLRGFMTSSLLERRATTHLSGSVARNIQSHTGGSKSQAFMMQKSDSESPVTVPGSVRNAIPPIGPGQERRRERAPWSPVPPARARTAAP